MKTKVGISQAEFFAFHGYYDEERKAGNLFLVDAEVTIDGQDTSDKLHNTVNYEQIYRICHEEMSSGRQLLETVVVNILKRFKSEIPTAQSAKVRLEKISPQLGGKVGKAIVEMEF